MARPRHELSRIGAAFGYPSCCIIHFCQCVDDGIPPPMSSGPGPWDGTGFIPCRSHAMDIRAMPGEWELMVRRINASRRAPFSFGGESGPECGYGFVRAVVSERDA